MEYMPVAMEISVLHHFNLHAMATTVVQMWPFEAARENPISVVHASPSVPNSAAVRSIPSSMPATKMPNDRNNLTEKNLSYSFLQGNNKDNRIIIDVDNMEDQDSIPLQQQIAQHQTPPPHNSVFYHPTPTTANVQDFSGTASFSFPHSFTNNIQSAPNNSQTSRVQQQSQSSERKFKNGFTFDYKVPSVPTAIGVVPSAATERHGFGTSESGASSFGALYSTSHPPNRDESNVNTGNQIVHDTQHVNVTNSSAESGGGNSHTLGQKRGRVINLVDEYDSQERWAPKRSSDSSSSNMDRGISYRTNQTQSSAEQRNITYPGNEAPKGLPSHGGFRPDANAEHNFHKSSLPHSSLLFQGISNHPIRPIGEGMSDNTQSFRYTAPHKEHMIKVGRAPISGYSYGAHPKKLSVVSAPPPLKIIHSPPHPPPPSLLISLGSKVRDNTSKGSFRDNNTDRPSTSVSANGHTYKTPISRCILEEFELPPSAMSIVSDQASIIVVFDTCVFLSYTATELSTLKTKRIMRVCVPFSVLDELDGISKTADENKRAATRRARDWIDSGIDEGRVRVQRRDEVVTSFNNTVTNNDDRILGFSLFLIEEESKRRCRPVYLCTNDKMLRVKAKAERVKCCDHKGVFALTSR